MANKESFFSWGGTYPKINIEELIDMIVKEKILDTFDECSLSYESERDKLIEEIGTKLFIRCKITDDCAINEIPAYNYLLVSPDYTVDGFDSMVQLEKFVYDNQDSYPAVTGMLFVYDKDYVRVDCRDIMKPDNIYEVDLGCIRICYVLDSLKDLEYRFRDDAAWIRKRIMKELIDETDFDYRSFPYNRVFLFFHHFENRFWYLREDYEEDLLYGDHLYSHYLYGNVF